MNDDNLFIQPAIEIHWSEKLNKVSVQSFSTEGKPHQRPPRQMKNENLPALLFQLVDHNYQVVPQCPQVDPLFRVIRAYSSEFSEQQLRKHEEETHQKIADGIASAMTYDEADPRWSDYHA